MRKILVLLAVANLFLGVALFGLRSPLRPAPAVSAARPPLPAQVQQLQAEIAAGRHGAPFALALSDSELTALAAYLLVGRPELPFSGVRVAVTERGLVGDAVTKGLAVTVPVRATVLVGARDGTPWIRVQDVSLGDTPVPGFLRDQIVRQVNAGLDLSRYNLAVTADAVELRPGTMSIRGTVK